MLRHAAAGSSSVEIAFAIKHNIGVRVIAVGRCVDEFVHENGFILKALEFDNGGTRGGEERSILPGDDLVI